MRRLILAIRTIVKRLIILRRPTQAQRPPIDARGISVETPPERWRFPL